LGKITRKRNEKEEKRKGKEEAKKENGGMGELWELVPEAR